MDKSWRRSVMHGDNFDWLGGRSVNQKALEVNLHPLPPRTKFVKKNQECSDTCMTRYLIITCLSTFMRN